MRCNSDIEDKELAGRPCVINITVPPCSPLSCIQVNFDIISATIFISSCKRVIVACTWSWWGTHLEHKVADSAWRSEGEWVESDDKVMIVSSSAKS